MVVGVVVSVVVVSSFRALVKRRRRRRRGFVWGVVRTIGDLFRRLRTTQKETREREKKRPVRLCRVKTVDDDDDEEEEVEEERTR